MEKFDVIIIGGGPGGYVCAIRAAQNGLKVACVEKRSKLGGTCLNVGCIPSKALLESSHLYYEANKHFADHGIIAKSLSVDFDKMMERKNSITTKLAGGIDMLFKKNKVTRIVGSAKFISKNVISVTEGDKTQEISANKIVIATGSEVATLGKIVIDEKNILSSTGALELKSIPKSITIVGAGFIGLEMASIFARLGSEVTVIEYADQVLPAMDIDVANGIQKILNSQNIKILTSHKIEDVKVVKNETNVEFTNLSSNERLSIKSEKTLIATGRIPNSKNIGLEAIGVEINERGYIKIDNHFQTNIESIYAIGDVVPGVMLAHKAEEEGYAVANILANKYAHINYDVIPGVMYTNPEIATVGKTEKDLKALGIEYKISKFNFNANSRAQAISHTDGFVKLIACKKTDKLLGAAIIGKEAGHLIHELAIVLEFSGSTEDIAMTCHAHPSLSEAIKEAAIGMNEKNLHC